MKVRGKKCLITGAASGIGRATALAAAARGADLFLTDIDGAKLAAVVGEVQRAGGRVSAHAAFDIADLAAVRRFADAVHAAHRSLDVVMNIAGISVWGLVEELEPAHWQRVVDVNLMGPIHVIQCFIPPMIAAGRGGHLVNVASAAALFGLPWHAAYSASKFGLRGLSEVLRFDLRRHGIGVSLVCPGAVDTPLVDSVQIFGVDTSRPDMVELRRRFRRHAVTPAAVAEAILRGVERDQYMVFTSLDIRVGHWFQQKFALPYEWLMRRLNDRLHRLRSM
ncbi:SDR family oxidoreductase [Nannocystis pusilla]|uniref:SDR family oxidoreductase n=1 Tax=Nannocystis pusilla TaxID=889268 RepID=A0ABS7TP36_9BACT|nr:SDR family oxidoreductase [Nannocystis pusilla]MBZ5709970.1 SDR family oxidoreductase [Nannocystis pusilla]